MKKQIDYPFHKEAEKLATSFYVSNIPNSVDAKGLWKICTSHGLLVDTFIANKLSKGERVLVEVHGMNYDIHMHELGTWNINIVDETLDSFDNFDVNGMEKVEDSVDENSLANLNDLNDLKETINELASNEIQHPISKENMD
ncbi:hypothetical protein Tco_0879039 [Tanacetum coccineum]